MPRTRRVARRSDAPPPQTSTVQDDPAGTKVEFVRVDEIYDKETNAWVLRDSAPYEPNADESDERSPYHDYCFLIKKHYNLKSSTYTTYIVIKSKPLRDALDKAINDSGVIYRYSDEPEVLPESLLPFYYVILEYLDNLDSKTPEDADDSVINQLDLLLDYLRSENPNYFATIDAQLANNEISFDYLRAILIPGREFYITDTYTGQPRAVILRQASKHQSNMSWYYSLSCEYLESYGNVPSESKEENPERFGRASYSSTINQYKGSRKINSFNCFPMEYHPRKDEVRRMLIERGKRWASYDGMHHITYNGVGYSGGSKHYFKGRAIVDKATYRRINTSRGASIPDRAYGNEYDEAWDDVKTEDDTVEKDANGLTDDDYVLATPILYGFALEDKEWAEFNVDIIEEIVWNDEAFANLVLPSDKKSLIQALVEAHSAKKKITFDDFIIGKGQGLVINLFGPPGVGKTMSAEATSEHLRKPLYVVGAGDLGTNAGSLDAMLSQIFDIGHTWNAVVLIDEADVFLEERSVHDLERNALVAVFLRQLEYFAGILFLTTNRVRTFDPAFASRIHVALRYNSLDEGTKRAIWKAFLSKVGAVDALDEKEWEILKAKNVNGRQIKNTVKTAQALAYSQQETLAFRHVDQVLTVMEQFERDLLIAKEFDDHPSRQSSSLGSTRIVKRSSWSLGVLIGVFSHYLAYLGVY